MQTEKTLKRKVLDDENDDPSYDRKRRGQVGGATGISEEERERILQMVEDEPEVGIIIYTTRFNIKSC